MKSKRGYSKFTPTLCHQ